MTNDFLTDAFSLLTIKISKLNKYKYKADGIFTENYKKIKETHEQLPDWAFNKKEGEVSFFRYQSPSTGQDITLKAQPLKLEDQLEFNTLQKLKMYHWLLAEGFEEFEKFVVKAYAYCGVEGISIWTQPKGWKHEDSREINHYLKKLYGEPFIQLDAFRASSDHFAKFETNGPTQTNYRVLFALIEQFRHRIVHNGGYCKDLQIFLDGIQKRLPDIDRKTYTPFVESYFFLHGEDHLIDLLEYEAFDEDGTPNGCYHDTVPHFLSLLVEYAQLIVESIQAHPTAEENRQ
ncbi:hypothetical protein [Pseudomonas sp. VI4.1]|uniref:hypothetical protein n=1 Tax=Pseudomonas sp. VI4.1 TaxID=1941346 RepID=UPI0009CD88A5|nr:hypothetical protein [Pseudomonas sp. VI4.1]OPK09976.1 hypothetical protein BZ163_12915 [Pseudomonas sp. VI4.1]